MTRLRHFFAHLWRNPVGFTGFALSVIVTLAALFAPLLAPSDPVKQTIRARFSPPSSSYLLGSDNFGRDVLSRVLYGYRISLAIAFSAVGLALVVGGSLGLAAAYLGGWADRLIMRAMDVLSLIHI